MAGCPELMSDPELLASYQASRSPTVCAEIVRRHTALVYRTCRRRLDDPADVDDAVQAVFVALVQKPQAVRSSLAGWLHEMARSAASHLLRARSRRDRHEEVAARMRSSKTTGTDSLKEELDAALAALPARQREAVILRYLEGHEQEEAARMAGCPRGTLSRRAAEGIEHLRGLLRRRGVEVAPAMLVGFLAQEAAAAVPAGTLAVLNSLAAAGVSAAGSQAVVLAQAVGKAMLWAKLKFWGAIAATAVVVGGVAVPLVQQAAPSANWTLSHTLPAHPSRVTALAYSQDGRFLASADYTGNMRLWDLAGAEAAAALPAHAGPVRDVTFAPNSQMLASRSDDGVVRLWDVAPARVLAELREPVCLVYSLAFSPDGKLLATADLQGGVKVWEFANQQVQLHIRQGASQVAFSPDGQTLALGTIQSTRPIELWDVASGRIRRTIAEGQKSVRCLAFSPDGRLLAAGCSPEFAWGSPMVRLWDVTSGQERPMVPPCTGSVMQVAFAPDGKLLAAACADGTVRLRDPASGKELSVLRASRQAVWRVAFSPDGKSLACDAEGTIKIWHPAE